MKYIPRTFFLIFVIGFLSSCDQSSFDSVSSDQSRVSIAEPVGPPDEKKIQAYREEVDELSKRIQRLRDINDIKRLQRIFGYYFDAGLWDEITPLFAQDATLEYARDGVYQGKERIKQYFYTLGGGTSGLKTGQLNQHFQLMPVITLSEDGNAAKGRWRDLSLQKGALTGTGDDALWGEGPYENEYVKQSGVWKISKLHWFQTVLVPYEGGWANNEDVNKGIYVSDTLPPDMPPSSDDGYWPATFLPPFHFDNPVATYQPAAEEGGQ